MFCLIALRTIRYILCIRNIIFIIEFSFHVSVCADMNQDYKDNYGKCGSDYGRCNSYHNKKFLYCDLATDECHDSVEKKNAQANDYYDAYPSSTCASNFVFYQSQ